MEKQKVKNLVDIIPAFNRVLGNPAKNHYNLGVTKGKRNKDKKVAAAVLKEVPPLLITTTPTSKA